MLPEDEIRWKTNFNDSVSGVSFDTSLQDLISQIPVAMQVFANGVEAYINDPENENNTRFYHLHRSKKLDCFSSIFRFVFGTVFLYYC